MNTIRSAFESLVAAGVRAPSADNRHCVVFELTTRSVRLRSTVDLQLMPGHRRILSYISYAAVVENMLVCASLSKLVLKVDWFPDHTDRMLICEIHVVPGASQNDELAASITARHTNRRFFHGPPLTMEERSRIQTEVRDVPGIELLWLDSPAHRRIALSLVRLAETERFASRFFHRELFNSIRFDLGWGMPSEEGLSPGSLEVERPLRAFFAALRRWSVARTLNLCGMHHFLGLRAGYLPCRTSPHVCALVTTVEIEAGALAAGRALERAWLRSTAMGLSLQPLAAAAIFALSISDQVRPELRQRLAAGWDVLAPGRSPIMLFRLGRASKASVINSRRPLQAYLSEVQPS